MSKELTNMTDSVMGQIREGKAKMHSRAYFIFGSFFVFVGLISSLLTSVFLIALIRFSLRSHGPMGEYRLEQILSGFPWWVPFLAVLGLVIGMNLIRRYDFVYKVNFKLVIIGTVLAVIATGWIFDASGFDDVLVRRGPMQGIMRQYLQDHTKVIDAQSFRVGRRDQ